MWKCASKSLKRTFKDVLQCNTVLSTNSPENKNIKCFLKLTPVLIEHCNRYLNIFKSTCEGFSNDKGDKEKSKHTENKFIKGLQYQLKFITWSSAFAIFSFAAYYKCKGLHYSDPFDKHTHSPPNNYHKALGIIFDVVGVKPYHCVIPEVQASKNKTGRRQVKESTLNEPGKLNFSSFEKAHQKILGTLNNFMGNQCIQSGDYEEALEYFIQSAEENYAAGIFNLGLCHEKGYGTRQDYEKAAEFYQRAANLGHATAMYNLGVFYAQGRGGITRDMDQARKLFQEAARLGQEDALTALNLETQTTEKLPENILSSDCAEADNTHSQVIFDTLLEQSLSSSLRSFGHDKVQNHSFEFHNSKEANMSSSSDSGILDLSPSNDHCVLFV